MGHVCAAVALSVRPAHFGLIMPTQPISQLIDSLLATEKTMSGAADWRDGPYHGEQRVVMPLRIGGVSTGADLIVSAYPLFGYSKFRIMICAPKCIWRIDHVTDE